MFVPWEWRHFLTVVIVCVYAHLCGRRHSQRSFGRVSCPEREAVCRTTTPTAGLHSQWRNSRHVSRNESSLIRTHGIIFLCHIMALIWTIITCHLQLTLPVVQAQLNAMARHTDILCSLTSGAVVLATRGHCFTIIYGSSSSQKPLFHNLFKAGILCHIIPSGTEHPATEPSTKMATAPNVHR